ncbi:SHOCT domain-containing protein [Nocardioides sp. YIM 152588]|uniref:SHOCT domain-containing protein n=1 Tax=Nocardioides sp. YIM 152588 TaxID=3158259 RepID=UPI0032E3B72A
MALFQELSGQGRVVGGHLSTGTIVSGGATPFAKHGDLTIQHRSNPFKRHRINAETVREWEELESKASVIAAIGQAAARVAFPGRVGKSVGAGVEAALSTGHIVRIHWADAKQSILELPQKQFMVFSVMLVDRKVVTAGLLKPEPAARQGAAEKFMGMASAVLAKGNQTAPMVDGAEVDVTAQIAKLASLHAQGILTDAEFSDKKAELLGRL